MLPAVEASQAKLETRNPRVDQDTIADKRTGGLGGFTNREPAGCTSDDLQSGHR